MSRSIPNAGSVVPLFPDRHDARSAPPRDVREADRLARETLVDLDLLAQVHTPQVITQALRLTS